MTQRDVEFVEKLARLFAEYNADWFGDIDGCVHVFIDNRTVWTGMSPPGPIDVQPPLPESLIEEARQHIREGR